MEAFVQMTGYVGGDVNFRNNTMPVADFRLASTPRVQRGGEWTDGETTWITVKAFKALAEHVRHSVRRGDPVIVIGRLRTSVWERDGVIHERLELDASTVGHDLRRGMSRFRRPERAVPPREAGAGGEPAADEAEPEPPESGWDAPEPASAADGPPAGAERAA